MDDWLYSSEQEYSDSLDEIYELNVLEKEHDSEENVEGIANYSAYCITGTQVTPEYQYILVNKESRSELIIREYSDNPDVSIDRGVFEQCYLRCDARLKENSVRVVSRIIGNDK